MQTLTHRVLVFRGWNFCSSPRNKDPVRARFFRVSPQRMTSHVATLTLTPSIRSWMLRISRDFLKSVEWTAFHPSYVQAHKGGPKMSPRRTSDAIGPASL